MPERDAITGRCACGKVNFRAAGPFREALACHCESCRRQSGHYIAATAADPGKVEIENAGELTWYRATPDARRGFCRNCGSLMFWEPDGRAHLAIMMGAVDNPGDIRLAGHIFVGEKGAYYEIGDGLPQRDKG